MDRRKLLVGGSAAAAAATLTALAGRGIPAAAASPIDGESTTADHARQVLGLVNVDLGLVDPAGLQSRFQQGCAAYAASPAPRDTDPTPTTTMETWTQQRIVDLCGTDSFVAAATDAPQTRALLSFGLLASSQRQQVEPPQVYQDMPVPGVLNALEPDFFPVLLDQIDVKSSSSPAFANGMNAGSAQLDQLVATFPDIEPSLAQARRLTDTQIMALIIIVVVNLAMLKTDGWR